MQKNKKSIAKILLAIMVIFALAVPVSGMAFATEDIATGEILMATDAPVASDEISDDDLTAPAAEGEGPLADGAMPSIEDDMATDDTLTTGEVEAETEEETNKYAETFWALVPPIIAIGLALITKEVYSSLLVGIIFGALLSTSFNVIGAVD
ncbi:MAG: hypothetical protein J6V06_08975, partial [Clostridia bacterium]|nr:hypothetical protein [Clostridia bacterium]